VYRYHNIGVHLMMLAMVCEITIVVLLKQGVPWEIVDTHELAEVTLVYRRECKADDVVECLVNPANPETAATVNSLKDGHNDNKQMKVNGSASAAMANGPHPLHPESTTQFYPQIEFLHLLRLVAKEVEINRGLTGWRRRAPQIQQ
jgi:fatty acyl-ACP thioesterase A